tara:strand:+ start:163 stop:927 length:765 start_codon:yes stop_codon:yes gene_type:complete
MLPSNFKPKKNYKLARFGSDNDGGYLLDPDSVLKTEHLIAFGLGSDWNFEKNFFELNNRCKIYCFDFKINKNFWIKNMIKCIEKLILKKITFKNFKSQILNNFKFGKFLKEKNIFLYERPIAKNKSCTDLDSVIEEFNLNKNIFLKIDIEGSEYRILEEIISHQEKITGLVIEFHDIDLHRDKIKNFINHFSLNLIHIHPNNVDYLCDNNDPVSLEMSFSKNPEIINDKEVKLPNILDQKNTEKNSDHDLRFES